MKRNLFIQSPKQKYVSVINKHFYFHKPENAGQSSNRLSRCASDLSQNTKTIQMLKDFISDEQENCSTDNTNWIRKKQIIQEYRSLLESTPSSKNRIFVSSVSPQQYEWLNTEIENTKTEIKDIVRKIEENKTKIEDAKTRLISLKESKTQINNSIQNMISQRESFEEIFANYLNEHLPRLINKNNVYISQEAMNFKLFLDDIQACNTMEFVNQVLNLSMWLNIRTVSREEIHKIISNSYTTLNAQTIGTSLESNDIVNNFLNTLSADWRKVMNKQSKEIKLDIDHVLLFCKYMIKINAMNMKIKKLLNFKGYKAQKSETKALLEELTQANLRHENKKDELNNTYLRIKAKLDNINEENKSNDLLNSWRMSNEIDNEINNNIKETNKKISEYGNKISELSARNIEFIDYNNTDKKGLQGTTAKGKHWFNSTTKTPKPKSNWINNFDNIYSTAERKGKGSIAINKVSNLNTLLSPCNNGNTSNTHSNSLNNYNDQKTVLSLYNTYDLAKQKHWNISSNLNQFFNNTPKASVSGFNSRCLNSKTSEKNVSPLNKTATMLDVTKGSNSSISYSWIKDAFCYFKLFNRKESKFNPWNDYHSTPEHFGYFKGFISFSSISNALVLHPRIDNNSDIKNNAWIVKLDKIWGTKISFSMKEMLKINSAYRHYCADVKGEKNGENGEEVKEVERDQRTILNFVSRQKWNTSNLSPDEIVKSALLLCNSKQKWECVFNNYEDFKIWINGIKQVVHVFSN